jgi:hypothetical protein
LNACRQGGQPTRFGAAAGALEAKALAGELATVDAEEVEEAATAPMPALAVESEVEGRLVDALREASVARRETASGADIVVGEAGEGR